MPNNKRNNNNGCICPHDGKHFATRAALLQHKRMVHQGVSETCPSTQPRRRNRRGPRNGGAITSDLAPSRVPTVQSSSLTTSGSDKVLVFTIKAQQSVIQSIPIHPGSIPRLSNLCKSFQRITWRSLVVYVSPQVSTTINGGYVAGIVTDPDDEHITSTDLSATAGSQTKKWYQDAIVRMPPKSDKLYTSAGEEPRFSSPGTFWICSEGTPSSDLTIVVTFKWKVHLEGSTLEDDTSSSFVLSGSLNSIGGKAIMGYKACGSITVDEDVSKLIPASIKDVPGTHFFRVPTYTVEYSEGVGDTGTIQMHFVAYKTDTKNFHFSEDGSTINASVWQNTVDNQVLCSDGTYFKYTGQGNACKVASTAVLRSSPSPLKRHSRDKLQTLSRKLASLEASLKKFEMLSPRDSMTSSLELIPNQVSLEQ
uniref:C2H2-type domain-containing protein n=1 Tax=Smithfield permutotetra-like virus TaxID=2714905 RepID=A0A6G7M5H2_9VIRU|nr:hypothetical protein [Smithfield permutotetra-like virus]